MLSSEHPAAAAVAPLLPHGPSEAPRQTTFRWLAQPYALLDDCAATYGDTFTLRFTRFGTHVVVSHPDDVRRVFAADRQTALAGRGNALLAPILGETSVLLLDGAPHVAARAVLQAAMRPERTAAHAEIVAAVARAASAQWSAGRHDLLGHALATARSIILRAVCGVDDAGIAPLSDAIDRLMAIVRTNAPFDEPAADGPLVDRFRAAQAGVHAALDAHLATRQRDREVVPDLTSALLAAGLQPAAIRAQLLTMIMAGHETTAAAITWGLLALHATPAALACLRAELDGLSPAASVEQLTQLPYLRAVCFETLRLYPPIPVVSRWLDAPLALRTGALPAGVFVTASAYGAHRRAETFPDPTAFRPERFLGRTFGPSEYFPFGGGTRRCLGMALALTELPIVLATWLRAADFTLHGTPRPTRRAVTIIPGGRWHMDIRPT